MKTIVKMRDGETREFKNRYPMVSEGGPDTFELTIVDADMGVDEVIELSDVESFEWRRK